MRRIIIVASLVLAGFTSGGCATGSSSSSSSSQSYSGEASPMACTHWNNIRGDIHAGILTDAELRTKVSEVRDSATDPTVKAAATKLLSGITRGSESGITEGFYALQAACS